MSEQASNNEPAEKIDLMLYYTVSRFHGPLFTVSTVMSVKVLFHRGSKFYPKIISTNKIPLI